jgi:predicted metal-dependent HD superfamily phosphohydrolase
MTEGAVITLERWQRVWGALGATTADESVFHALMTHYGEPHRHYHTLRHLEECLGLLDEVVELASHPAEIELALWFHDAIYDVRRQDNEGRSAEWARSSAEAQGLPADVVERIVELVLVTRHDGVSKSADQALLVDIDLAILGSSAARFAEYDTAIREEYEWVPAILYNMKRKSILRQFLGRPAIFTTPRFVERYEQRARANLQASISR